MPLGERDAAAAEFGFAVTQATAAIVRRDDEELLRLYTHLLNGWARYLEAQESYFLESLQRMEVLHAAAHPDS